MKVHGGPTRVAGGWGGRGRFRRSQGDLRADFRLDPSGGEEGTFGPGLRADLREDLVVSSGKAGEGRERQTLPSGAQEGGTSVRCSGQNASAQRDLGARMFY